MSERMIGLLRWDRLMMVAPSRAVPPPCRQAAHLWAKSDNSTFGCKRNLGHPVNDLFELRAGVPRQAVKSESFAVKRPTPLEVASRQGIECPHGGSDHDQPVCNARPLSLPKRTDLVEVRKDHRPQSLRRCSQAG